MGKGQQLDLGSVVGEIKAKLFQCKPQILQTYPVEDSKPITPTHECQEKGQGVEKVRLGRNFWCSVKILLSHCVDELENEPGCICCVLRDMIPEARGILKLLNYY